MKAHEIESYMRDHDLNNKGEAIAALRKNKIWKHLNKNDRKIAVVSDDYTRKILETQAKIQRDLYFAIYN